MLNIVECNTVQEQALDYADQMLLQDEQAALEAHLQHCRSCRRSVQQFSEIQTLLRGTGGTEAMRIRLEKGISQQIQQINGPAQELEPLGPEVSHEIGEGPKAPENENFVPGLFRRVGAMPWWMISGAFHGLILVLITMIGLVMLAEEEDFALITELEHRKEPDVKEEPQKRALVPVQMENVQVELETEQPIVTHEEMEFAEQVETPDDSDAADTQGENGMADLYQGAMGSVAALGLGGGRSGAFGRPGDAGGRLRRAIKGGGGKDTESAVERALAWLARHQEPDGHWDSKKYGADNGHQSDIGCSGLALLAFLGAGHSEKVGKYRENVRRAVHWFLENQADDGQLRCESDPRSSRLYGQGIATMAISEAAAMGRMRKTREAAQKAINFVSKSQNRTDEEGYQREAWGYKPQSGINDTSVTAWMALALKSSKVAGLDVDPRCFEGTIRWLDAMQGTDEYKLGIWYRGTIAKVKPLQAADPKMRGPLGLLAAAAVMRMYLQGADKGNPRIVATGERMLKYLPKWDPKHLPNQDFGRTYFFRFYYGTLCLFQIGGPGWKQWNEALKKALLPNQVKGGEHDGSWDPAAAFYSRYGGRVYTTAMGALCLEVYYRYLPMFRD